MLFAVFGWSGGSASASGEGADRARVRVLDFTPLTLKGLGFEPREKIRLTVSLEQRIAVRGLRANVAGSFGTRFDAIRYDRCQGSLAVKAVGSNGTRVSWELMPLDCPAAGSDS